MSVRSKIHHECTRKKWHENSKSALEHAARLNQEEPEKNFGVYVCLFCNGLHVGHMKSPRNKIIPEDAIFESD